MMTHTKLYDKVFLTGCDKTTEWMLPWFLNNFLKHNKKIPIIIGDFGLSDTMREKMMSYHLIDMSAYGHLRGWFKKPQCMIECPAKQTVWIDTDCEVLSNIESIFNFLVDNKLNMVQDLPWSLRTQETWHNSGVVGFKNKPEILRAWAHKITLHQTLGDQEVLHSMFNDDIHRLQYINGLPNIYNWLRVQLVDNQDSEHKKIMHWTGRKGKLVIQEKIRCG